MARLTLRSKFRKLSYKNAKTPEGATDFLVLTKKTEVIWGAKVVSMTLNIVF